MHTNKGNSLGVIVALLVVGYCGYVVNHIAEVANKNANAALVVPEVTVVAERDAQFETVAHTVPSHGRTDRDESQRAQSRNGTHM